MAKTLKIKVDLEAGDASGVMGALKGVLEKAGRGWEKKSGEGIGDAGRGTIGAINSISGVANTFANAAAQTYADPFHTSASFRSSMTRAAGGAAQTLITGGGVAIGGLVGGPVGAAAGGAIAAPIGAGVNALAERSANERDAKTAYESSFKDIAGGLGAAGVNLNDPANREMALRVIRTLHAQNARSFSNRKAAAEILSTFSANQDAMGASGW